MKLRNKNKKETIAIGTQKGGEGKTTTAENFAGGLAAFAKRRVLLIDLDPQANVTLSSGVDNITRPTIYEALTGGAKIQDTIQERSTNVYIIPASGNLAEADIKFTKIGKEQLLKKALAPIVEDYDYIVIDTPPALGILTINALTAAQRLIVPAQADIYSLQGIGQLYETVKAIQEFTNPALQISGILLTRYNSRSNITRDMTAKAEEAAKSIGTFVYNSVIRECVALKGAHAEQAFIFDHAPTSNASLDYQAFIKEFLERSKI